MSEEDHKEVRTAVYAPPSPNFPYLAVVFVGEENPEVTPFETVGEAERFLAHVTRLFASGFKPEN
jgi:hypothetical protein